MAPVGPQQVIATQTYRIKIDDADEIIIDKIIAGRRQFYCAPARLIGRNHIIDFTLSITIHQKSGGGVTYIANIVFVDDKVSACEVEGLQGDAASGPAVVIYGHDDRSFYNLTRDDFDQSQSQYNK